jgi:hypothetical protein
MKEEARYGREKYTYQGVTFIYDPQSNREVTSYRAENSGDRNSRKRKNSEEDDYPKQAAKDVPEIVEPTSGTIHTFVMAIYSAC